MTAALWDGPYLLGQFNRYAGRPDADQITDAIKYQWLSEAQQQVVADIAARQPEVLYFQGVLEMPTTDGGKTFGFGQDINGSPIFPMGKVRIFTSPSANPFAPLVPGMDYLQRATFVEIPNGNSRPQPLYWSGIIPPGDINATQPPVIEPAPARVLITELAVKNFGQAGNINPDMASAMTELWTRDFPRWMLVFRDQFVSGGALGPLVTNPVLGPFTYTFAAYLPGTAAL